MTTPTIVTLETSGLGDRSYLAHDGRVALVVDPQRDIDRVLAIAEEHGVRITHVFETHIHNDYVSGGLALARAVDAAYHVNADDPVEFERTGVRDGDVVEVSGRMSVRVVATPGHTHTHLSYVLVDTSSGGDDVAGAFTGGSLLIGATGRPDLLGPDHTQTLVRDQWSSAHRLAGDLPDETPVLPTHGFGSFCSANPSDADSSTIGREKQVNPVLTQDQEAYAAELLAGLESYPAYYAHMGPANAAGPSAPDLSTPEQADVAAIRRAIDAGEWVVDLRTREAFAAGHVQGTLNFGTDGPFVTYLGWLIPWGTPLTLLGESAEQVAEAQRELVRIGIDRPAAQATGGPEQWTDGDLRSFPRATFAELADAVRAGEELLVLDVRRAKEHAGGHIEGALNVPIHNVLAHLDDVPHEKLWVHCAGGYRASVVAGILAAHGHDVVAVDDPYTAAEETDLPRTSA